MTDLWPSLLKRISRRVGPRSFRDWFEPLRPHAVAPFGVTETDTPPLVPRGASPDDSRTELLIAVPNQLFKSWMERNFQAVVEEVLAEVTAEAAAQSASPSTDPSAAHATAQATAGDAPLPSRVRFIVAAATARSATSPERAAAPGVARPTSNLAPDARAMATGQSTPKAAKLVAGKMQADKLGTGSSEAGKPGATRTPDATRRAAAAQSEFSLEPPTAPAPALAADPPGNEYGDETWPPRAVGFTGATTGATTGGTLDRRYTFDNFVVGSCNQFAHAAARAAADAPGRSYNPLYLYGGVGLGKTHLMQAMGHALASGWPELRICYASAERFMCEMVNAIRWKRTPEFRDRFRNIDALLIDDIQFLEGKEATQEEFFHTFRSLYEEGKQVVLTSDCPPRELATLEERLRSRFESGLIADMQVPDLETKLAILRRKADNEGIRLEDDVALFLVNKVRSNVRELEGCLTRLLALASLRRAVPDIALVQEATRDLFDDERRPVTVEAIQRFVADYYSVKVADLKARNNSRSVTFPRQVAMYLCKKLTVASYPDIGKKFGGKHHSTVIHSVQKIEAAASNSQDLNKLLSRFLESIQ